MLRIMKAIAKASSHVYTICIVCGHKTFCITHKNCFNCTPESPMSRSKWDRVVIKTDKAQAA